MQIIYNSYLKRNVFFEKLLLIVMHYFIESILQMRFVIKNKGTSRRPVPLFR